ncbi:MAG: tetratricopeptide repeat protein, partial [Bacteroidota bacterium]
MRFLWVYLLFLPSLAEAQCSDISISERVDSLITISRAYTGKRKYDLALATSAQAEELARLNCGETSAAYGSACFNQGRVRYFMGNNQEAVPWYEKSRDIRGRVLGTDHEDYGKSLNNLAISYGELSRYEAAEPLYRKALEIREAIYGRESVAASSVLSNLASLYRRMGHYEAAEALGVEAMEIRGRVLGKKHRLYSGSLNNLASLYVQLNQDEKALAYYRQSLEILQAAGDTLGRNYAIALRNLGAVHFRLQNYDKAEMFFTEGRQLVLTSLGEGHYLDIAFLHNLGLLYEKTGDQQKGLDYLSKAIEARESRGDTLSLAYVQYLLNYAGQLFAAKIYDKAKEVSSKALSIAREVLAEENKFYSNALVQSARCLRKDKAFLEAKPLVVEASRLERERLARAVRHLTEEELGQIITSFIRRVEWQYGFVEQVPNLATTAYDNVLFYKGFLLQASRGVDRLMAQDQEQYDQLKAIYRQLAKWY